MDKEYQKWQFNNYNSLCEKAKEIIFYEIAFNNNNTKMFKDLSISDNLIKFSPIEQILFIALVLYTPKEKDFDVKIWYQKQINVLDKMYIADFCIEEIQINNRWYSLNKPIIIECDGYEYHSSKIQLSKDYEREQKLKLAGYDIIRFTGSQIYNNPKECSNIIYMYIKNLIKSNQYKEK